MSPDWENPYKIRYLQQKEFEAELKEAKRKREFKNNLRLGILSLIFFLIGLCLYFLK